MTQSPVTINSDVVSMMPYCIAFSCCVKEAVLGTAKSNHNNMLLPNSKEAVVLQFPRAAMAARGS